MSFWQKFLQRFTRFQPSDSRKVRFFTQKSMNQIIIVKKFDVNHSFPNIYFYFYKKSSDKLSMFHATWGKKSIHFSVYKDFILMASNRQRAPSYEIKSPRYTILWFRILGIFSVENIKRSCVFMFQTWDNSQLCTDSQYSSQ